MSAELADKASVNAPHHRDGALGFNTVRTLDRGQALFRFGTGIFHGTNLSHFGCSLSVILITRSDRGVDSSHRDSRPSKRLEMVSAAGVVAVTRRLRSKSPAASDSVAGKVMSWVSQLSSGC